MDMAAAGGGDDVGPEMSPLLFLPHDVWAGVAWCLDVRDVTSSKVCCKALSEEATDAELWFHLFMRSCWPPSGALLAFAEGCTADPLGVDWFGRLRSRAESLPWIVLDVGRGYSKYGIVHGLRGRPEGNEPPRVLQLCSSPTHPPDCDHSDLMDFIHMELDVRLAAGAAAPDHPLHL